jgi:hypothetical protein
MTFPTNNYDFGRISMGESVTHTFVVSNSGNQTLEITAVTPGCHCTTVGIGAQKVEPGHTGAISLKFDSSGVHGDFIRYITVAANDKIAPRQTLTIRGTVWMAIEISPSRIYMNIAPDAISNTVSVVHIRNGSDKPLTLSNPVSTSPSFKAVLKEVKPGMDYELAISPVPPFTNRNISSDIAVSTSFAATPVVHVPVVVTVQAAVTVIPQQIVVPIDAASWVTNKVTFTSNLRKPLVLSDPVACCDGGIALKLEELNTGKKYQLVVAFPPGFRVIPGQEAQVSVKANNSEQPLLVIPIRQYTQYSPNRQVRPMGRAPSPPPPVPHP